MLRDPKRNRYTVSEPFLHSSMLPLDEAVERSQFTLFSLIEDNSFEEECEGHCGV